MSVYEDFLVYKSVITKTLLELARQSKDLIEQRKYLGEDYHFVKREILKKVYCLKTEIMEMETDSRYYRNFTKKGLKQLKTTAKQLLSACDKLEKALRNDDILLIF